MVEISLSHCKILYQSELFVVIFLENFDFYVPVIGIIYGTKKQSKSVLALTVVQIVGTS